MLSTIASNVALLGCKVILLHTQLMHTCTSALISIYPLSGGQCDAVYSLPTNMAGARPLLSVCVKATPMCQTVTFTNNNPPFEVPGYTPCGVWEDKFHCQMEPTPIG